MGLETVIRFRCNTCGCALEFPQSAPFPCAGQIEVSVLPPGWSADDDGRQMGCPEHPMSRIVTAAAAAGHETVTQLAAIAGERLLR